MNDFRNGLIAGALIVVGLVMWQPAKAKDWGWTARQFVTALPAKISSALASPPARTQSGLVENLRRKKIVLNAKSMLGKKYVSGGDDPATGFDCSGLVQHVMWKNGVKLPRVVSDQFERGREIDIADLREGDLLFFQVYGNSNPLNKGMNKLTQYIKWAPNHVGIYAGKGKMIHAPRSGKTVETVKINTGFWKSHLMTARDPLKKKVTSK